MLRGKSVTKHSFFIGSELETGIYAKNSKVYIVDVNQWYVNMRC